MTLLSYTTTATEIAAFAGSVTVVMLTLLLAGAQLYTRLRRPRLILNGIHTEAVGCDRDLGMAATFELRAALRKLRSEDAARVDLVTAAAAQLDLPSPITTGNGPTSFIATTSVLLRQLLPPLDTNLDGCLQPSGSDGVGISLSLSDAARGIGRSVTLRQSEYGRARTARADTEESMVDAYSDLLVPAAVWVHFHTGDPPSLLARIPVVTTIWARVRGANEKPRAQGRRREPFGVHSWESYALAASGAHVQAAGDAERARQLYAQALDIEPTNRLALFNLAVLDMREKSAFKLERACKRFRQVRALSEHGVESRAGGTPKRITDFHRDGIWCRATYNLAVVNLLLVDWKLTTKAQAARRAAAGYLAEVIDQMAEIRRQQAGSEERSDRDRYCREMLPLVEQLEDQVLVTAVGILARVKRTRLREALRAYLGLGDDPSVTILEAIKKRPQLSARARYNLACCLARRATEGRAPDNPDPDKLEEAMEELELALDGAPRDLRQWARKDPSLDVLAQHADYGGRFKDITEGS